MAVQKNPHAPKLTVAKVSKARRLVAEGKKTQSELAREFGVTVPTLHMAVTGKTWGWLTDPPPVKVGHK